MWYHTFFSNWHRKFTSFQPIVYVSFFTSSLLFDSSERIILTSHQSFASHDRSVSVFRSFQQIGCAEVELTKCRLIFHYKQKKTKTCECKSQFWALTRVEGSLGGIEKNVINVEKQEFANIVTKCEPKAKIDKEVENCRKQAKTYTKLTLRSLAAVNAESKAPPISSIQVWSAVFNHIEIEWSHQTSAHCSLYKSLSRCFKNSQ